MRVTRYPYEVPGWGVGEIWVRDGVIVQHELASEALRNEASPLPRALVVPRDSEIEAGGGERALLPKPSTAPPNGGAGLPVGTVPGESPPAGAESVSDLCRRIISHLEGVPTSYEAVAIDLGWATPLQLELAAVARSIPWGEVVSYGELAALAGRPRAARAAGAFCADNRFSLIVPCHRVIAANGIGGYGTAGPSLKRRLLALEGVFL